MLARRIVAAVCGLLLAVQIVRTAAVAEYVELDPETAAAFWRGHPAVELAEGMLEIAQASRQRQPVSRGSFDLIDDAARKAPLAPQPYLVHGVAASISGRSPAASADFVEAQRRDPRSLAAAYFLAQYYFRTSQPLQGLRQTAVLARLLPTNVGIVASYVAQYAHSPSQWPQIRKLFRSDQSIEDAVLIALARDPSNATAVLAIADTQHRQSGSPWLPVLLQSLVDAGDFARARAIWTAVARPPGTRDTLIYDPLFSQTAAPPPFNWTLTSSRLGIAEREAGQGLHVIYYGEEKAVLASQLLMLTPGTYRLDAKIDAGSVRAGSLSWTIRCANSKNPISSASATAASDQGWTFEVPQGCAAQWIGLAGTPSDIAEQSEMTLREISVSKVNAGA
jgi:hypothetical protein